MHIQEEKWTNIAVCECAGQAKGLQEGSRLDLLAAAMKHNGRLVLYEECSKNLCKKQVNSKWKQHRKWTGLQIRNRSAKKLLQLHGE